MYTSVMGTLDISVPINYLGSTSVGKNISTVVDRTDPSVLPSQEEHQVTISTTEVAYQAIFNVVVDSITNPSVSEDSNESYLPALV